MTACLATILYIILCILLFSAAIAIHEFGHFIVALKLGLRVERFSLGFGPALWKKTYKGVEYRISAIPLGGYVSIPDVDPEGTKALQGDGTAPRGLSTCTPWKEFLVAVAGPAMNLVLAVFLAVVLSLVPNAKFGVLSSEIGGFPDEELGVPSPAREAGMLAGDVVISVAGRAVHTWSEMQTEIQIADTRPTEFVVRRGGETLSLTVTPFRLDSTGPCLIGAHSVSNSAGSVAWMPDRNPLKQLAWDAGSIFRVLKGLVTPSEMKATGKAIGGPIMIAEGIYASVRRDIWDGIGFLRFINVNLAVINLLPIPVLDGGLIMFALIALVFRRRVPEKAVAALSTAFMVLLMGLAGLLICRDTLRSWRMHRAAAEAKASAEARDAGEGADEGAGAPTPEAGPARPGGPGEAED
ncbi:MAG: site-2 protease family protein [Kiritimatiellae bacterium]|nr:site-2 protease family protein [Kiritimatiellia bacterium]